MAVSPKPAVTAEHYKAFGRIIQNFVWVESMYSEIVGHLLQVPEGLHLILFSQHSYGTLKNQLTICVDHANFSDEEQAEIEKLISKVHDKYTLRNNVAHSVWKDGRRPKTIKPLVLKTKNKLFMLGTGHNERDWTAQELKQEADEILLRAFRVGEFFRARGVPVGGLKHAGKRTKKTAKVSL